MSEQLDRIEAMVLRHGILLLAIADVVEQSATKPNLDAKDLAKLRRAITEAAPWRKA